MPDSSSRYYLFDKIIIAYSLLMVLLILILGRPFSDYLDEILFYIGTALFTYLLARFVPAEKNRVTQFVRLFYPGLLFTFFYRTTGGLMYLLFDSFYDWQLTAFEKSLFGVHPTIYIDQHLLNVVATEIISFCYFAYYFMIPVFMIILFIKKEYSVLKSYLAAVCLTFFTSYILFFLYPIEGPRWYFDSQYSNTVDGPFFRQLVEYVIANGAVRGGCMPSSHFGVALVIWLYTWKYYRKHAYWFGPIVLGLAIGTVWGRFHYVSDVIIGGLIGLIAVLIIWKYDNRINKILYKH